MKKKILLVSALAVLFAVAVSGTLAYFTADEVAHNIITSGSVEIDLVEKMQLPDGTLADFPQEGISGLENRFGCEHGTFRGVDQSQD